jgi:hypothetical protein
MTNLGTSVPLLRLYPNKPMEQRQGFLVEAARSAKMARNENEVAIDLRSLQKPLKEQYRNDPNASRITIRA